MVLNKVTSNCLKRQLWDSSAKGSEEARSSCCLLHLLLLATKSRRLY